MAGVGGCRPPTCGRVTASFTDSWRVAEPHLLPGAGSADVARRRRCRTRTTIVALTCADGVVMAGDRRATMGNIIAQRDIEKVFIADSHSAIGIAGTAGFAVEMVRLFQLELEHYEKIEGVRLSLDGKANRLATMIRGNLGHGDAGPGRGAAVRRLRGRVGVRRRSGVPAAAAPGRIFSYDIAGGKYEEHDYYSVGSGSMFARSALKKRYEPGADLASTVRAAIEALYDAADDDSATGGPDLTRRIFPVVVAVTAAGAVRWTDDEVGVGRRGRRRRPAAQAGRLTRAVASRRQYSPTADHASPRSSPAVTMPIYASPEQFMRDRSEYARKGIARGRSVVVTTYAGGVLFVAENHSPTLHKVSEIYDRIGFAGVGRYNEFENLRTAGIRLADVRGFSYDRRDVTGRWLANAYAQTVGSIFSEHQKPFEVELCVAEVSGAGAGGVGTAVGADQLYRISYDGSIVDERRFVVMGGATEPVITALTASFTAGLGSADRARPPRSARWAPPARARRASCCRRNSRSRCSIAPWPAGPSAGCRAPRSPRCWPGPHPPQPTSRP